MAAPKLVKKSGKLTKKGKALDAWARMEINYALYSYERNMSEGYCTPAEYFVDAEYADDTAELWAMYEAQMNEGKAESEDTPQ